MSWSKTPHKGQAFPCPLWRYPWRLLVLVILVHDLVVGVVVLTAGGTALGGVGAGLLGALGTFVTGSGTSSEVLFGNVQLQAASSIGADSTWLVAANSLGTSAGKMLSPQNIAIGCAACGLVGKDGVILGKIAKYAFGFAIAMAVLVFVGFLVLA